MNVLKNFILLEASWDYDEFVRVWNELDGDKTAVGNHFGISPANAAVRASNLRKLNFDIKLGKRGRKPGSTSDQRKINKEQVIDVLKKTSSDTEAAATLGVTPYDIKKFRMKLSAEGEEVPVRTRGNKRLFDISEEEFTKIYQSAEDSFDLVDKLRDAGLDVPITREKPYIASLLFRVNQAREARGENRLKRMPYPTGVGLRVKAPRKDVVSDEDLEFNFDDDNVPVDENPWDEDTQPDIVISDLDNSFANIWNSSASLRDAFNNLMQAGWQEGPAKMKEKVSELRSKGVRMKDL